MSATLYALNQPAGNRHPRHADSGREHDNQRQRLNQRRYVHPLKHVTFFARRLNVAKEGASIGCAAIPNDTAEVPIPITSYLNCRRREVSATEGVDRHSMVKTTLFTKIAYSLWVITIFSRR